MTWARALALALALLLFNGAVADQHDGAPLPEPSMPDPCTAAPTLPFCRSERPG